MCDFRWDNVLSWATKHKDNPSVKFICYEDMLNDHEGSVRELAGFLQKDLTDDQILKIVNHTKFNNMKDNEMVNMKFIPEFDQTISNFFRKGKSGDWKNYFSNEQLDFVNERNAAIKAIFPNRLC